MPVSIFPSDYAEAEKIVSRSTQSTIDQVAHAIAKERERCALIAEAIDSNRGNEKRIAAAIREPLI